MSAATDLERKPLPAIPAPPSKVQRTTATLTVEATAHLRKFITHALREHDQVLWSDGGVGEEEEEEEEEGDATMLLWVDALEATLNELNARIVSGGWLAGVRRARNLRKERLRRERDEFVQVEKEDGEGVSGAADEKRVAAGDGALDERDAKLSESQAEEDRTRLALEQLDELVSRPVVPTPTPTPKHLLLTVAPYAGQSVAIRGEDDDFQFISSTVACKFTSGAFSLPVSFDRSIDATTGGAVLYGLREWDVEMPLDSDSCPRIVGGTFTFKGAKSRAQHDALLSVLHLATYTRLALLLEQHFLRDSHVPLRFPPKAPSPPPPLPPPRPLTPAVGASQISRSSSDSKRGAKPGGSSRNPGGLWGFLNNINRKTEDLRLRAVPMLKRSSGSLDLPRAGTSPDIALPPASPASPSSPLSPTHQQHLSSAPPRTRTFSFLDAARAPFVSGPLKPKPPTPSPDNTTNPSSSSSSSSSSDDRPFSTALRAVLATSDLLSTSPGVRFPPPLPLVSLAAKEEAAAEKDATISSGTKRLRGDEKVALHSLLGWRREDRGKGMAGTQGFVRHQAFCALYSAHVPGAAAAKPSASGSELSNATTSSSSSSSSSALPVPSSAVGSSSNLSASTISTGSGKSANRDEAAAAAAAWAQCSERRTWVSYYYYDRRAAAAEGGEKEKEKGMGMGMGMGTMSLGEAIGEWCARAEERCERPECEVPKGGHEMRWIHAGVRIHAQIEKDDEEADRDGDGEKDKDKDRDKDEEAVWMYEACKVCGKRTERTRMSDGTHLMAFGKFLELLVYSPAICALHPPLCEHTTPASTATSPSASASTSTLANAENVDLPPSRLDIIRHFACKGRTVTFSLSTIDDVFEIRVPRLQIVRGAGEKPEADGRAAEERERERDKVGDEARGVLRQEIGAWWKGMAEQMDILEDQINTDKAAMMKTLPRLPSAAAVDDTETETDDTPTPKPSTIRLPDSPPPSAPSPLASERSRSRSASPSKPPPPNPNKPLPSISLAMLGNLRRTFQRTEQELYRQLAETPNGALNDVRRAFEAAARGAAKRLAVWKGKHIQGQGASTPPPILEEPAWWGKSYHAVPGGSVIVREDDWGSIIAFTLSSQDYLRELANFSITRNSVGASSVPATPATPTVTRRSYFPTAGPLKFLRPSEPQPDPDEDGVIWHESEACSAVISRKQHPRDPSSLLTLQLRKKTSESQMGSALHNLSVLRSRVASAGAHTPPPSAYAKPAVEVSFQAADGRVVRSAERDEPGETAGKLLHELEALPDGTAKSTSLFSTGVPSTSGFFSTNIRRHGSPSVLASSTTHSRSSTDDERDSQATVGPPPLPPKDDDPRQPKPDETAATTTPSYAATITNGIAQAMKLVASARDALRPEAPPPRNHHGLLSADFAFQAIDDRPHIKYDWTIGKRLKFSCTVYYAKQFDALRRRCGVEDVFLKSMERSANWSAEGGKSKSNFWKTADDRFIIKTLVNAWNVADLQVLIDLGPSYFRYMEKTASKATVLAKLLGFYTVEIRNLETGATQAKADLLVMENLFYDQKIVKTFDLKGMQGRRVKARSEGNKTLFDGEWIEGQQRALTLVHPHCKVILREAIKSDCAFLAESNIMDYSLLLGIDAERKQIACGLVDTIGSYTFAKTLEYKAKHGLAVGAGLATGGGKEKDKEKEVTVIPPQEYQDRFVNAMDAYFLACPNKWARPLDGTKELTDPWMLPSVI
ncbi:hypothetical protein PUNSTDRAFT_136681 [Punctularia strigosozonata HHB-11173 SS5]|uniref:uncharacterized protein n=1 Tax=Punctularia strigosozonata (strain HHB-11173) TaxID=741275 RepID=UPI0004416612|nr:uncharacterized protein PUNSTDRAFT_136681 [Punctularia strigosozonata HHB-11173 SS5]EIN06853.1 hypothetical protein PUNSTDRAFT_136681 [Punctularia strigosozonata HHB-11173 SS5]